MCGILGIFRPDGNGEPEQARRRLKAAAALIAHRGPDAEGIQDLPGHGLAFAHRRLSILDLDPRAHQPMASADGNLLIAFNGEIYNFRELRGELEREGARFRTRSDTEVLLEGARVWGHDRLLERVAGMFAFALYDRRSRTLILARDRAGKKPLFYSEDGPELLFCSELRGLNRLRSTAPELDPAGLDAYLSLKFTPPPGTLLRGVRKLGPGQVLEKRAGGAPKIRRYWTPLGALGPASRAQALDRIEEILLKSVRRRLVSDVPVCLFLSGGLDSSLIAAELSAAGSGGMTAYTVGYKDLPGYSEFEYARRTAGAFALRHEELSLGSREALETLEDESSALDEPVADWIWVPLHHLSRRARADGFKVVLVGEGSDELFFGYDSMEKGLRDLRRMAAPLARTAAKAGSALLAPVYRRARRGHRRYDLMRRAARGEPIYMGSSAGWTRSQRHQVAGPLLLEGGAPEAGAAFVAGLYEDYRREAAVPGDEVNLVCYVEFLSKMTETLLQRVDRVTMLHSLEARCPFLDHELAELAFSLPGEWKRAGGLKSLLKDLGRRKLPQAVVDRPKMGFSFPFKEWLRGELGGFAAGRFEKTRLFKDGWINGDFCRDLLAEHRMGWGDHAPRLWLMLDLARWYDRWVAR